MIDILAIAVNGGYVTAHFSSGEVVSARLSPASKAALLFWAWCNLNLAIVDEGRLSFYDDRMMSTIQL